MGEHEPALERRIGEVTDHVERNVGKIDWVFHEIVSDDLHIDVHIVKPTKKRPRYVAITSGMSCLPMAVPPEASELRFAELVISLPVSWPMRTSDWKDEKNYWPIRLLKQLARYPFETKRYIRRGHTLQNDDPPTPYGPGTKQCAALVLSPLDCGGSDFWTLRLPRGEVINFYSLIPIYLEEMVFHRSQEDPLALFEKLEAADISDVVNPRRKNVGR